MLKAINLDHAAAAPLNKNAKKALKELLDSDLYNTDSSYKLAVEQRRLKAELKSKIAKLIGVKSPNITITSGSSDATNILLSALSSASPDSRFITTNIEHSSLLDKILTTKDPEIIKIGKDGKLDLAELAKSITDKTLLISVQYVNNETGQVLPIKDISKVIQNIRIKRRTDNNPLPIFLHTDASQAVITQDIQVPRLGVDAMSLNGSKFGALPSTGILYLSSDILRWLEDRKIVLPQLKESLLAVISLYHALNNSVEKKNTESKRILNLAQTFWSELQKELPEVTLNPKNLKIDKSHSAHILNIYLPGVSGERLVILSGLNNILISTGAACSASKNKPSHVLEALGLEPGVIQSSIRVSFGSANKSEQEVKLAAQKLVKLCQNKSVKL